jgi:hypothetical protein
VSQTSESAKGWKQRLIDGLRKGYRWSDTHIPTGLRLPLGLVLVVAGIFGFLPVLGFWMIPLGVVVAALDIPRLRRRIRKRLEPQETGTPGRDD